MGQRFAHPKLVNLRCFQHASIQPFLMGGVPDFGGVPERLNSLDFHPSFGPSGYDGYPGGVLHMQYHSTLAVPDLFFAPSDEKTVIG